jgi:hypothetical protein
MWATGPNKHHVGPWAQTKKKRPTWAHVPKRAPRAHAGPCGPYAHEGPYGLTWPIYPAQRAHRGPWSQRSQITNADYLFPAKGTPTYTSIVQIKSHDPDIAIWMNPQPHAQRKQSRAERKAKIKPCVLSQKGRELHRGDSWLIQSQAWFLSAALPDDDAAESLA